MTPRIFLCFALAALLSGCPSGGSAPSESGSSESKPLGASSSQPSAASMESAGAVKAPQSTAASDPDATSVESTAGRWLVDILQAQASISALVIDLKPGEPAAIVALSPAVKNWKVLESEISETSGNVLFANTNGDPVRFTFEVGGSPKMRGNATYGQNSVDLIELSPSTLEELPEARQTPLPGARELAEMAQNPAQFTIETAREFVAKHELSPLVIMLSEEIVRRSVANNESDERTLESAEALVASAAPWGKGPAAQATVSALGILVNSKTLPVSVLQEWVARAQKLVGEDAAEPTKLGLKVVTAIVAVRDEQMPIDDVTAAVEKIAEALPGQPIVYDLRSKLAARAGDNELALEVAAELLALPFPGGDSARVAELYASVHDSEEGLDEYLDRVYDEHLLDFSEKQDVTLGRNPVLIELFTGGSCPPCVAADVSLEAIETLFPENVNVIRYHLNIPMADPLATLGGKQRFEAYQLRGTPSLVVNGVPQQIPGTIGGYEAAKVGYLNLTKLIESVSKAERQAETVAIAEVHDGTIRVGASAKGIPADTSANVVVAIVANELNLVMPNKIRRHGMVVRALPAGAVGMSGPPTVDKPAADSADDAETDASAEPGDGDDESDDPEGETKSFSVVTETKLEELKTKLTSSLLVSSEVIEANRGVITDLSELSAVVFLQNSLTGEVISSVRTPVVAVDEFSAPLQVAAPPADPVAEKKPKDEPAGVSEPEGEGSNSAKPQAMPTEGKPAEKQEKAEATEPDDTAVQPAPADSETRAATSASESPAETD